MARNGGLGALIALGLVVVLSKREKLTASSFYPTFTAPSITLPAITYEQYFEFVTMPVEDVEADDALELVEASPIVTTATKKGQWLTVKGRIPTPSGKTIPIPTRRVGRIAVEKMLQPIEEAAEEPHFQDVGTRRSVNLRLKPM